MFLFDFFSHGDDHLKNLGLPDLERDFLGQFFGDIFSKICEIEGHFV